jgi:glutamate-1-semialdehyde 2,1-aminomutase
MADSLQTRAERRDRLVAQMIEEGKARFPISHHFQEQASGRLVSGGSHTVRLFDELPCWVRAAQGAYVTDLDGRRLVDLWQGHYANLLGHNPAIITDTLAGSLCDGFGLQTGMQHPLEQEVADLLCRCAGAEMARLTTSGSLSTMYAVMLARAFTGRDLVLKIGGGWHGAQPWSLKGVSYGPRGYGGTETQGLPESFLREVIVARFNDVDHLEATFRECGDRIACLIIEPFLGGGSSIAAYPEFLTRARELTRQHGALLILDEVISGFRFRAGTLGALYGLQPDLTTLGKIAGGGMPVAAVVGRADVLRLCGREGGRRVRFEGGTYSAHPLSMLAARTMMQYLIEHEGEIYPSLGLAGARLRERARLAFEAEGIVARSSGEPSAVMPGSSIIELHFPYRADVALDRPEVVNDPAQCDVDLRERVARLAFLLEDAYLMHAGGALSTAHGEPELERVEETFRAVARRLRTAGLGT